MSKYTIHILLYVCTFCFCTTIYSQESIEISGDFSTLKFEKNKLYNIVGNVTIKDSLIAESGVKIIFSSNSRIISNGYVNFNGEENSPIVIDGNHFGFGFFITNSSASKVIFNNIIFKKLKNVITFNDNWYRTDVVIQNSIFINNKNDNGIVSINDLSLLDTTSSNLILKNNVFTQNRGGVYIENLVSNNLNITIINNAFINNSIYTNESYFYNSNMIFGKADKFNEKFVSNFSLNFFKDNFLIDIKTDTILSLANFGIYGNSDSFPLKNNYFLKGSYQKINGIYDFRLDPSTPKISNVNIHNIDSTIIPHFNSILKNGVELNQLPYDSHLTKTKQTFSLISNRTIVDSAVEIIFFYDSIYVSESKLIETELYKVIKNNDKKIINNGTGIELTVNLTDSFFITHNGYLTIANVFDKTTNRALPTEQIGKLSYLIHKFNIKADSLNNISVKYRGNSLDTFTHIKRNIIPPIVYLYSNKYSFSIGGGMTSFIGSVGPHDIFKLNLPYSELSFSYRLNPHFLTTFIFQNGQFGSSDINNKNTNSFNTGFSFKTNYLSIAMGMEYYTKKISLYNSDEKVNFSIGVIIEYLKFNPQGYYLGEWYDLQPLGTGGQTIPNSINKPYPLTTPVFGPMFGFKYSIAKNISVGARVIYHYSLSQYLDDVGADLYPDPAKLAAATKPALADAAVYFSNPNNVLVTNHNYRSNSSTPVNDSYFTFGFFISKNINGGSKKKTLTH